MKIKHENRSKKATYEDYEIAPCEDVSEFPVAKVPLIENTAQEQWNIADNTHDSNGHLRKLFYISYVVIPKITKTRCDYSL